MTRIEQFRASFVTLLLANIIGVVGYKLGKSNANRWWQAHLAFIKSPAALSPGTPIVFDNLPKGGVVKCQVETLPIERKP
jgi:hypothetical protein